MITLVRGQTIYLHFSSFSKLTYFFFHFNLRLGLHLVIRIFVESAGYHISLLSAIIHNKIRSKENLTTVIFQTVMSSDDFVKTLKDHTK